MIDWKPTMLFVVLLSASCLTFAQEAQPVPGTPYKRHADVIYGRKHGVALTMDVIIPAKPNGAAVIWAVSSGFTSSHDRMKRSGFVKDISILLDR